LQPYLLDALILVRDPAPLEIYTLSLHDALPISAEDGHAVPAALAVVDAVVAVGVEVEGREGVVADLGLLQAEHVGPRHVEPGERSEEHTSELQSRENLVCRLLLEKTTAPYVMHG